MSHLRILDLGPDAVLPASTLVDLGERRIDLVIVRNVVDPSSLARVVETIEARRDELPWVGQASEKAPLEQMALLGSSLTPYAAYPDGPPMDEYLDHADRFRKLYAELFAGNANVLEEARRVLSTLGGHRPVILPTAGAREFTAATIRRLPPGKGIPTHVGRWFQTTKGFAPLLPQVHRDWQLSWFVPLQQGESGGDLLVYSLEYGDPAVPWKESGRVLDDEAIERGWATHAVRPNPGDLLVFNGGRLYHRVSPIVGSRPRYTFGGFAGLSADQQRIMIWN